MAFSSLVRPRQQSRNRGGHSINGSLAGSDDEGGYSSGNPTCERPSDRRSRRSTQSHNSLYRLFTSPKADKPHTSITSPASMSSLTASSGLRERFTSNGVGKKDRYMPKKGAGTDFQMPTMTNTGLTDAEGGQMRPSSQDGESEGWDRKNIRSNPQSMPHLSSPAKVPRPGRRPPSHKSDFEQQHAQSSFTSIPPIEETDKPESSSSKASRTIYDRRRSATKHRRTSSRISIGIPPSHHRDSRTLPTPLPPSAATMDAVPLSEQTGSYSITPSSLRNPDTKKKSRVSLVTAQSCQGDSNSRRLVKTMNIDSPSTSGLPLTPQRKARHGRILSFSTCENIIAHIQHRIELSSDGQGQKKPHIEAPEAASDSECSANTVPTIKCNSSRRKSDHESLDVHQIDAYILEIIRRGRGANIPSRDHEYLREIANKVQHEKTKRRDDSTEGDDDDDDDDLGFLDLASLMSSGHPWDEDVEAKPALGGAKFTIPGTTEIGVESESRSTAVESGTDKECEKQKEYRQQKDRPACSSIPEDTNRQQYHPGSRLRHSQSLSLLCRGLARRSPSLSSLRSNAEDFVKNNVTRRRNIRNSSGIASDRNYWGQADKSPNTTRLHDHTAGGDSSEGSDQHQSQSRNTGEKHIKRARSKRNKRKDKGNRSGTSLHKYAISAGAIQGNADSECMSTSSAYSESSSSDLALPLPPPFKAPQPALSPRATRKRNLHNKSSNSSLNGGANCSSNCSSPGTGSFSSSTAATSPSTYMPGCTPPSVSGIPRSTVAHDKTSTHDGQQGESRNNRITSSPLRWHEQRKEVFPKRGSSCPVSSHGGTPIYSNIATRDTSAMASTDTDCNPRVHQRRAIRRLSPKVLRPLPQLLSPEAKLRSRRQALKNEEFRSEEAYLSSASVSSVTSSTPSSATTAPSSLSWSAPAQKPFCIEQKPAQPNPLANASLSSISSPTSSSASATVRESMLNIDAVAVSEPPRPMSTSPSLPAQTLPSELDPMNKRSSSLDTIQRPPTPWSDTAAQSDPNLNLNPHSPMSASTPSRQGRETLIPLSERSATQPVAKKIIQGLSSAPASTTTVTSPGGTDKPLPPPLVSCSTPSACHTDTNTDTDAGYAHDGQGLAIVSVPASVRLKDGVCEARELFVVASGGGVAV